MLWNRYRLTVEEFDRMMEEQGGECALCPKPARVVDHCHAAGHVRGLLCYACNSALGRFETEGWADRAAAYVKG